MAKERIQYIDIAKGIGITLVVLAHSKFPLNHFVTMFYLPMFFFISGCFFSLQSDIKTFCGKKTKQLYLRFVIVGIIMLMLHPIFLRLGFYCTSIPENLKGTYMNEIPDYGVLNYIKTALKILALNVPEQLMRPMWFIGALWIAMVLLKVLNNLIFVKINNIVIETLIVIGIFAIGYFVSLPSFFSQGCVAMLFCWFGSKCMKNGYLQYMIQLKTQYQILLVIIGFGICAIASWKTDLIFMTNTYTSWWTMLTSSCFGMIAMLIICYWISKTKCGIVLSYIGQHTIAILAMHMVCFKLVNLVIILVSQYDMVYMAAYPIITNDGLWWLLYSVVGVVLPLFIQNVYYEMQTKIL